MAMIDLIVYFFVLNSQQKLSMYFPKRVPEETFFPMRGKTFDNIVMLHEYFHGIIYIHFYVK